MNRSCFLDSPILANYILEFITDYLQLDFVPLPGPTLIYGYLHYLTLSSYYKLWWLSNFYWKTNSNKNKIITKPSKQELRFIGHELTKSTS